MLVFWRGGILVFWPAFISYLLMKLDLIGKGANVYEGKQNKYVRTWKNCNENMKSFFRDLHTWKEDNYLIYCHLLTLHRLQSKPTISSFRFSVNFILSFLFRSTLTSECCRSRSTTWSARRWRKFEKKSPNFWTSNESSRSQTNRRRGRARPQLEDRLRALQCREGPVEQWRVRH